MHSATTILCLIYWYFISSGNAAQVPGELKSPGKTKEKEVFPAAHINYGDSGGSGLDEYYEITNEEIEKNRIIIIDQNGNEKISTDEEVIKTLELVHSDNSTFLHDEPHFQVENEKRAIFGSDDRFQRTHSNSPYSAMGYLSIPGARCSAYLVGPRHLITAAHCLHPRDNTNNIYLPSQITFFLKRNCNQYGWRYTVSEILVYSQYRNHGNLDYDLACLLLSATASNWMGFAYRNPMPTVSGETCGYPGDRNGNYACFYCSRCSDVRRNHFGWWGWLINSNRLQYTCDTTGGMSGGPIITDDHDSTNMLYSYGVNTHESQNENQGVRITRNVFYDICRWKCNTGATCSAVCWRTIVS